MDNTNLSPQQSNQNIPPINEPPIPISEAEMNNQMHQQSPKSGINILLTLASVLIFASIVGITLWLYIQNNFKKPEQLSQTKSTPTNITPEPNTENADNDVKEINGIRAAGAENQRLVEKYGAICKRFTSIEEALTEKEVACILDLSGQNLTALPDKISSLNQLKEIDLSNNLITEFPNILVDMQSLQIVNLANNKLSKAEHIKEPEKKQNENLTISMHTFQKITLTGNNISSNEQENYKKLLHSQQIVF